jgi:hypothetical protein
MDIFCSSKFKNAHSKVLDFNVLHRHLLVLNKNNDNWMSRKPEKTAIFSSSSWCKFLVSCIMISWERKCKQMRWLVEHKICPCFIDWLGKWRPTCVMRHARGQKLQSFRRIKWPFYMDLYSMPELIWQITYLKHFLLKIK